MRLLTNRAGNTLADLHNWPARRWLVVAVMAVTLSSVMAIALRLWTVAPVDTAGNLGTAPPWWAYPIAGVSVVLVAMTVATYIAAPRGAEATFCDLRWPVIGFIVTLLTIDTSGPLSPLTGLLGSSSVATFVQPVLGALALALLVWALTQRMAHERSTTAASTAADSHDGDAGETCTTCRPLFTPRSFPARDRHPEGDLPK